MKYSVSYSNIIFIKRKDIFSRGFCKLKTFSKCKKKKEKKEIYFNIRLCIYLITNNQSMRTADYLNGSIKISGHIIVTFLVLLLELLKFY